MPELPEVETVVRGLRADLVGRTITAMWYDWANAIRAVSPEAFSARVAGQQIQAVNRRAKYIVLKLSQDVLLVHLKMTGRLYVTAADQIHEADRWVHVKFALDDGHELRFSDSRKFGRVFLADTLEQITGEIGPEPLDAAFTPAEFCARLQARQRALKVLLLDQHFIAGVGNIYADEALHRAGLHPLRRADTLTPAESDALYHSVRAALSDGIAREGASVNWYRKADGSKGSAQDELFVYGRTNEPCRTCGQPIQKMRVAQRGTHFCPHCQPRLERKE